MKMLFVHASEGTQVIAQAGPGAFHRVVMDFAHPIAVIVTCPFAPTWRVTNLLEYASLLWQVIIGLPFIRVDGTACRGMGFLQKAEASDGRYDDTPADEFDHFLCPPHRLPEDDHSPRHHVL